MISRVMGLAKKISRRKMRRGSVKGRVMLAVAVAALVLGIQQEPTRTSASMTDMVGRSWLSMSLMDADARVLHVVTGGERRKSGTRFIRAFALRGGAWISEEEEAVDKAGLEHADEQDVQAMTEDALDAFVEKCAQEATKTRATGGEMNVPPDMPYEDFVWTREFAEQGFDPLFMTGMTEEQAECARKEWISRIMDGEDDADQLSEHYKNEGNRVVNEARKIKAQGNENYTKLHSAAIRLYTDALRQNASSIVHRAVCHANRANSHLERSNFGHAIRDCNATLAIFDAVTRSSGASTTILPRQRVAPRPLDLACIWQETRVYGWLVAGLNLTWTGKKRCGSCIACRQRAQPALLALACGLIVSRQVLLADITPPPPIESCSRCWSRFAGLLL